MVITPEFIDSIRCKKSSSKKSRISKKQLEYAIRLVILYDEILDTMR